jgi:PEP-CTERM motif
MLWAAFSGFLVLLSTGAVQAQVATFATLDLVGTGNNVTFINAGAGSTLKTVGLSQPMTFKYKVANSYGVVETSIPATMTLTATAPAAAGTLGSVYLQPIQSIVLAITANTAVGGQTNLLTMNATGNILGQINGVTGTFSGDTGLTPPNTVSFTSSFLTFFPGARQAFTFNLNSITTGGVPGATLNANGWLNTFTAQATASFSGANVNAPEPGTMALLGMGMGMMGVAVRRRRKA